MKTPPPERALQFLRWFCREDYIEEIEGDLTEIFETQSETAPRRARIKFTWNVIRHFRPAFVKSFKLSNAIMMVVLMRHNLLLSLRSFMRYRMSFFINLSSLSVGLACALLIYLWVSDELRVDKFHENDPTLFQVIYNQELANGIITNEKTPGPLSAAMAAQFPEIEYATTATWVESRTLSVGDDDGIKAGGRYVGKDFFRMFTHPLLQGD